jgi:hypothetical protein
MSKDAEMVAKYREKAKDKSLPQDVKNMYLDKAVELEQKAYKQAKPTSLGTKMAKGGMPVRGSRTATNKAKKMMGGGYAMKTPAMAKGGSVKKRK